MNLSLPARATLFALLTPAVILSAVPVAAKPKAGTPKVVAAAPPVLTCTTQAADGLSYTVLKAGKGDKPGADSKVKVNYTGRLRSDGTQFDAGQGANFKVGGVVPGFGQGLQLMQPGGKYRLCIPAKLGYGAEGNGPVPANADMVFEVELLAVTNPPVIPVAERTCDKVTPSGLGYAMMKPGTGPTPTAADLMLVDFTTFDAKTGAVIETREWEKIPVALATATFGEALKMMQVGATYRFCMPVKADADPAAAMVNIKVDLIAIRPAPVVE